ncbi:uncharacterized protein LOC111437099 [Cucurbita moschata]|uniref:Uncharacterized protein LOC111437099 n=1 Tax=Cucurbita moschata TaxID=3662 RepID=A0A6J1ERB8_CUCMO|nr:uncharacterized protein LOC111437099 [Cucurbita moschata]
MLCIILTSVTSNNVYRYTETSRVEIFELQVKYAVDDMKLKFLLVKPTNRPFASFQFPCTFSFPTIFINIYKPHGFFINSHSTISLQFSNFPLFICHHEPVSPSANSHGLSSAASVVSGGGASERVEFGALCCSAAASWVSGERRSTVPAPEFYATNSIQGGWVLERMRCCVVLLLGVGLCLLSMLPTLVTALDWSDSHSLFCYYYCISGIY